METYIPKSSIRTVQRNLINTVRQNKQQLSFTDNRPVAVSQRKTLQNMGQQKPIQMMKTDTDMIIQDLIEPLELRTRFFTMPSLGIFRPSIRHLVNNNRSLLDYKKLDGTSINSQARANTWLTGGGENIYIWKGGQLIGGNNMGGLNKTCHPNLIGGDPDVDYAGTIEQGNRHWHVTRDSGHFQPGPDDATRQQIADHMNFLYGRQRNPLFLPH